MAWVKTKSADRIYWEQTDPAHRLYKHEIWLLRVATAVPKGQVALVFPADFVTRKASPTEADLEADLDAYLTGNVGWTGK